MKKAHTLLLWILSCACALCLAVIPFTLTPKAKASTTLTGVPFQVENGALNSVVGEGIISTAQAFTNTGFTLETRLTVTTGATELYLGENLEYYLRISPLGSKSGISVTKDDKRVTVRYNTFTGCDFAEGEKVDVRLTYDDTNKKLAFAMKKSAEAEYTPLSAKVNYLNTNAISSGTPYTNPNVAANYILGYKTITEYDADLSTTRIGFGTQPDYAFSVENLSLTGKGVAFSEDFNEFE